MKNVISDYSTDPADLWKEIRRLSKIVKEQDERIKALEKHSHVPVDFNPMLRRIASLEAKIDQ